MQNTLMSVEDYLELSEDEQVRVSEELENPEEDFVTVRVEESGRTGELYLYGVWWMTAEELQNYNNSGGLWTYIPVDEVRRRIEQAEEYMELV